MNINRDKMFKFVKEYISYGSPYFEKWEAHINRIFSIFDSIIYTIGIYLSIMLGYIAFRTFYWYTEASPRSMRIAYQWIAHTLGSFWHHIKRIGTPETKPCVYIMNHNSTLDFVLPATCLPWHVLFCELVDANVYTRFPFIGHILNLTPTVVVNRGGHREKIIEDSIKRIQEGYSLIIFPEGKRSDSQLEFKLGAFEIAKRAGCPVQPIVALNSSSYFPYQPGSIPYINCLFEPLIFEYGESKMIDETKTVGEIAKMYEEWFRNKKENHVPITKTSNKEFCYLSLLYLLGFPYMPYMSILICYLSLRYHHYNEACYANLEKVVNIIYGLYCIIQAYQVSVPTSYWGLLFLSLWLWSQGRCRPHHPWNEITHQYHTAWHISSAVLYLIVLQAITL